MNKKYLIVGGLLLAGGLVYFLMFMGDDGTGGEGAGAPRHARGPVFLPVGSDSGVTAG